MPRLTRVGCCDEGRRPRTYSGPCWPWNLQTLAFRSPNNLGPYPPSMLHPRQRGPPHQRGVGAYRAAPPACRKARVTCPRHADCRNPFPRALHPHGAHEPTFFGDFPRRTASGIGFPAFSIRPPPLCTPPAQRSPPRGGRTSHVALLVASRRAGWLTSAPRLFLLGTQDHGGRKLDCPARCGRWPAD